MVSDLERLPVPVPPAGPGAGPAVVAAELLGWVRAELPVVGGLGLDPNGFSHVLSGRGLDVLDDALNKVVENPLNREVRYHRASELAQHVRELLLA